MASEPTRISEHPYFRHTREQFEAKAAWERDNPELSEAWEEALLVEENRRHEQRLANRRELVRCEMPRALSEAGVPMRCVDVLGVARETPALLAVKRFVDGAETFCLLLGAAGSGKSVGSCWAVQDAIYPEVFREPERPYRRKPLARFMRAADMARMSAYGQEAEREFEGMCSISLLVLDDMGTERPSDTWLALLDELVDRRYGDRLKTILTSNLDAEAFKRRYGERISDRIRHDGVVIGAGANSMRTPRGGQ